MMNEKVYQAIFNEIAPFIPEGWTKLVVYLEYGEDSYSFSFYYKDGKKYTKCFNIQNISEDALFAAFKKIDKVIAPERKKTKGDLWSNMTMLVDSDGNMHTDFDYTDLSSGTYQFKKAWKKKYLV